MGVGRCAVIDKIPTCINKSGKVRRYSHMKMVSWTWKMKHSPLVMALLALLVEREPIAHASEQL